MLCFMFLNYYILIKIIFLIMTIFLGGEIKKYILYLQALNFTLLFYQLKISLSKSKRGRLLTLAIINLDFDLNKINFEYLICLFKCV